MMRTTLLLPESLYHRLALVSRTERKKTSELIRELLDQALAKREEQRLQHMYAVLKELEGLGGSSVTDASTTIDELLYGKYGAWRGSEQ